MSKPLTMQKVMEDLQGVLHDLQDLSAGAGQPFLGIVISGLENTWRDQGTASWVIRIEPLRPKSPFSEVETVDPAELPEDPQEEVDSNT